jgi:PAS domain S-box-containing protein
MALLARWIEALNSRDFRSLARMAHPAIELRPTSDTAPPGTSYHGHAGLASLFSALNAGSDVGFEVIDCHEVAELLVATVRICEGETEVDRRAAVYEFEDGLVRRVLAFATLAEAEEVTARSRTASFHAVFDNAFDPIVLLDDAWRFVEANEAAVALLGEHREGLVGAHVADVLDPSSVPAWQDASKTLLKRGQAHGQIRVLTQAGQATGALDFWVSTYYALDRHLLLLRGPASEPLASQYVLSAREREVFQLLAEGFTAPAIADKLFLSPATVRTHVQNGSAKLEAKTRIEAIAIALSTGEIRV